MSSIYLGVAAIVWFTTMAQTACLEDFSEPRGADAGAGGRLAGGASGGVGGSIVAGGGSGGAVGGSGAGPAPVCGNAILESGEGCDGALFGGKTCSSELGRTAFGKLACSSSCEVDTSSCESCGDGKVSFYEGCDGTNPDPLGCKSKFGTESTGVVTCSSSCFFDYSGCSRPACGNGKIDKFELCDGALISSTVTCASFLGPNSTGVLRCDAACDIELSSCSAGCNPITQGGCAELPNYGCVLDSRRAIACRPTAGFRNNCEVCKLDGGECRAGMHCIGSGGGGKTPRCTLFCETDADCREGGVCDVGQGAMGFGVCVTAKGVADAPCGAAGAGGLASLRSRLPHTNERPSLPNLGSVQSGSERENSSVAWALASRRTAGGDAVAFRANVGDGHTRRMRESPVLGDPSQLTIPPSGERFGRSTAGAHVSLCDDWRRKEKSRMKTNRPTTYVPLGRGAAASPLGPSARKLVLPVLAEVGWADGRLAAPERSAARGAARAIGLDVGDARLSPAMPHAGAAELRTLTPFEREALVGCGAWMALTDDFEAPCETAVVRSIAERAALPRATVDRVVGTARWVRTVTSRYLDWRQEVICLLDICLSHQDFPAAFGRDVAR